MKKKISITLIILLIAGTVNLFCQKPVYQWERSDIYFSLTKTVPGKAKFTLWKLNFDPALKPFFHPVSSPDGTLLSAEAPSDHLWHLGQWFCWKYINKLNYWEYTGDPKSAISEGMTELKSTEIKTRKNGEALITLKLAYHAWDSPDEVVMEETRRIHTSPPASDGSYYFDYDLTFVPLTAVILDRTPTQTNPGGVTWGGYAGLSMRFDQKLSDPVFFSDHQDSVINGDGHPFVAVNLKTEDGGMVQTVIFDDPGNPRYPSPWYTINRPNDRFWFFSPAILYKESMEIKKGEPLRLRYRVLMPAVPLTREQIIIGQKAKGKRQKLVQ